MDGAVLVDVLMRYYEMALFEICEKKKKWSSRWF